MQLNMSKITAAQRRFVEDMGTHMVGWGLPRTTGRTYAYLLIHSGAASLDDITADLGVAKSGASVAVRQLVRMGLARSEAQRGTRRLLFSGLNTIEAIFTARSAQALDLVERLREGARVAPTPSTRERLAEMARRMDQLVGAMTAQYARARQVRRAG
jgi:DNA-binding transcriptional regulator GbsR (MarR family)